MLPLSYRMKGDLDFTCVQRRHFRAVTVLNSQFHNPQKCITLGIKWMETTRELK